MEDSRASSLPIPTSKREHHRRRKKRHHVHHHYHKNQKKSDADLAMERQVVVETTRIVAHPEVLDRLTSLFMDASGRVDVDALKQSVLDAREEKNEKNDNNYPDFDIDTTDPTKPKHHRKRHRCRRHHKSQHSRGKQRANTMEEESVVESLDVMPVPSKFEFEPDRAQPELELEEEIRVERDEHRKKEDKDEDEGRMKTRQEEQQESRRMAFREADVEIGAGDGGSEVEEPEQESVDVVAEELEYMAPWELPDSDASTQARDSKIVELVKAMTESGDIWETSMSRELLLPPPPAFEFSLAAVLPHAERAMKLDDNLWNKRFVLVPGQISEDDFWRAYFWNVEVIKSRVCRRMPSGTSSTADASKVYNPLSFTPSIQRAIAEEVGTRTTPAMLKLTEKQELDADFREILSENGLAGVTPFFHRHGVFSISTARNLTDAALVELGFESHRNRLRFREILGGKADENVENVAEDTGPRAVPVAVGLDEDEDEDEEEEEEEREVEKEEVVDAALLGVLESYGVGSHAPEFAAHGAVSLSSALTLPFATLLDLGFNSQQSIKKFKRSLEETLTSSTRNSEAQANVNANGDAFHKQKEIALDSHVVALLEAFGFQELTEELVSLGVMSLPDLLAVPDTQLISMGFNTTEKIHKFRRAIGRYIDDLSPYADTATATADPRTMEFEEDVEEALDAFGLNAVKPALERREWVTVEALLNVPDEDLLQVGFGDQETIDKVKKELRKEHMEEQGDQEDKPTVAAPWDLPVLADPELSRLQDLTMFQEAVRMSSTREIWKCEDDKLINTPSRSFKFSLPMVLPHANVAMELDPQLRNARFTLIPRPLNERDFWMVYFWEMELLKLKISDALKAYAGVNELPLAPQQPSRIYCTTARSHVIERAIKQAYEARRKDGWTLAINASPIADAELTKKAEVEVEVEVEVEEEIVSTGEEEDEDDDDDEEFVATVYAAPWEMPPLSTERINTKRDAAVKDRVLDLSDSREIWAVDDAGKLVKPPPSDFKFSTHMAMNHINVALEEDEKLRQARFDLVPSVLDERTFWSAYFWEVEQIKLQVTDDIQTLNHEEILADMAFSKLDRDRDGDRDGDETVQSPRKIYESCTSSSVVRGVVLREHVRRKMAKHNSEDQSQGSNQLGDRFRALVKKAQSHRKMLKRVSFSFESDPDTYADASSSPSSSTPTHAQTTPLSKMAQTVHPHAPDRSNVDPQDAGLSTSTSEEEEESTLTDTEAEETDEEGGALDLLLDGSAADSASLSPLAASRDVKVVRRTVKKVIKFFIPPVLLIPVVIALRLVTALLVAMGAMTMSILQMTKYVIVKCLSSVVSFHRTVLLGLWAGVKYWFKCLYKFAKLIVSYVVAALRMMKMINVMIVKRVLHGTALVISKTRGSVKVFFVQLRKFSLQPLVYIGYGLRQIVFLPVTIGRKVVKRTEKTKTYIKRNKDDTMDILIAILGLGILFLIFTGVLFPFIYDIFAGKREATVRFEPVNIGSFSLPTLYIPSLDFRQKRTFADTIAGLFN